MKNLKLSTRALTVIALLLAFVALILAGCSISPTVKVGFVQNTLPDGAEASYFTFDGTERYSFRAKEGDEFKVVFEFEVEKGALTFQLISPDGEVVWTSPGHVESGSESVSSQALKTGRYRILVTGEETGGGYHFTHTVGDDAGS